MLGLLLEHDQVVFKDRWSLDTGGHRDRLITDSPLSYSDTIEIWQGKIHCLRVSSKLYSDLLPNVGCYITHTDIYIHTYTYVHTYVHTSYFTYYITPYISVMLGRILHIQIFITYVNYVYYHISVSNLGAVCRILHNTDIHNVYTWLHTYVCMSLHFKYRVGNVEALRALHT